MLQIVLEVSIKLYVLTGCTMSLIVDKELSYNAFYVSFTIRINASIDTTLNMLSRALPASAKKGKINKHI